VAKLYSTDTMTPLAKLDERADIWPQWPPRGVPQGNQATGAVSGTSLPWGWIALGVTAVGAVMFWDDIAEFVAHRASARHGADDDEEGTEYEDADDDDLDADEYLDSIEVRAESRRGSNKGSGWYVQMYSNDPVDEPYSMQKVKRLAGPHPTKAAAEIAAKEEDDVWYTRVAHYPSESAAWKRFKG